jgi:hypothetical protein
MGIFSKYSDPSEDWSPPVTWNTVSKKDPRFTMQGYCSSVFVASSEMDKAILNKAKQLGVEPPDDIEVSAWKR